MREMHDNEIEIVNGGAKESGVAIAANLVEQGAYGAVSGAGLGGAIGFVIGGPPGAAVLGLAGGGIGFISGMVGYALSK